jgi:hypothetical protein
MAFKKKADATPDFTVEPLRTGALTFRVLSRSGLLFNCVSMKAKQTLLLPRGRKTAADKLATLKHDPLTEFRSSVYAHRGDSEPTRLFFPGGGFKKSMENAALRLPGLKKTEVAQMTWIKQHDVSIFGVPQLSMAVTRSADMARTPDIRTRAILPEWAAMFTIEYAQPQLSDVSIVNLVNAAGLLCGIGDGRQEKGYGHGQFKIVSSDDEEAEKAFAAIMEHGGREAQDAALAEPTMFDLTTEELFSWYTAEVAKMGDRFTKPTLVETDEAETDEAEAA